MGRLAGKVIQIQVDEFSLKMAKFDPKQMAVERLAQQMQRDCPDCIGCKETTLHESMDHMRMARLFAITCKQKARDTGDIVRCPDGFFGMYDASAKDLKEVRLEMPTLTTTFSEFDPSVAMPAPRWVTVGAGGAGGSAGSFSGGAGAGGFGPGAFEREYLTKPSFADEHKDLIERMIEEKIKRAAEEEEKMLRRKIMLSEFSGDGVGKISAGLADMLDKKQIPTDRSSFPPVRPRDKDVPLTSEEEAW